MRFDVPIPFKYYGGSSQFLKHIYSVFTEHRTYVEVFGGSASVLLNKKPSETEVYNDIDYNLVAFWRMLRDNPSELIRLLSLTLYSREEYNTAREILDKGGTDLDIAWAVFVAHRQTHSGIGYGWSYDTTTNRRNPLTFYRAAVHYLPKIHNRIRNIVIENMDAFDVIAKYDSSETLFFLDPPYPRETISTSKQQYRYTFDDEQQRRLAETLPNIKGKFVLTVYSTDYYDAMLEHGVKKITVNAQLWASLVRAGKRKNKVLSIYYRDAL